MGGRLLEGRYRLDHLIARGGMAAVYTATDTRLDRVVAVKVMHRALADDPAFVERFTREARAAASLSSADVVAVHDQGTDPVIGAYLVMEYVDGGNLRDLLREHGGVSPRRALELVTPVLRALAAAHTAGLVHRDVKPENVLLGRDGQVKVADFGLARAVQTSTLTATAGLLLGTAAYLAPEQVTHGVSDPRSDVYAAGVLLFELLTGVPPYAGETPLSVAYRHVNEDVAAPSTLVGGISPAVDELVLRATRRDPAARPADAGAFLAELHTVHAGLPVPTGGAATLAMPVSTLPMPVPAQSRRRRHPAVPAPVATTPVRSRRRRHLAVLATAIAVVAVLAGAWWLGSGRYSPVPSVLGEPQQQAVDALGAQGFDVALGPPAHDEVVGAGQVQAQDPAPGGRAVRGAAVTLTLSRGPDRRVVPVVVSLPERDAAAALQGVGLRVGRVTREFSPTPAGAVVRSVPAPGDTVRPDSLVNLVVSRGVELLAIPAVEGQSTDRAGEQLRDSGFRVEVTEVFSDAVASGSVVAQSPTRGQAPRGSLVTLQSSKGPEVVVVPGLRGLSRDAATAELNRRGLRGRAVDLPDGGGVVVTQSPRAGSLTRKGSAVTFYVL